MNLKYLWEYECTVHRQCMDDLTKWISRKKATYTVIVFVFGFGGRFLISGLNAAIDLLIHGVLVAIGTLLLLYIFYRTVAPVKLQEKQNSRIILLQQENDALEKQIRPRFEIQFNSDVPDYFHQSPFFGAQLPLNEVLKSNRGYREWRLCRISIKNLSKTYTVGNVEVKLSMIEPFPEELRGKLPLRLHFMHDNGSPYKHAVDINPDSRQFVDVIAWSWNTLEEGPPKFTIQHSEIGVEADIPVDNYTITIEASAKDVVAVSKQFWVGMESKDQGVRLLSMSVK